MSLVPLPEVPKLMNTRVRRDQEKRETLKKLKRKETPSDIREREKLSVIAV